MWINRALFQGLIEKREYAHGRAETLERELATQKTTMDWLMVRLTQLEHERAQLIYNYMGVKITVPSIEPVRDPKETAAALGETLSFEDMGDEQALKDHVSWHPETGEIVYGKK